MTDRLDLEREWAAELRAEYAELERRLAPLVRAHPGAGPEFLARLIDPGCEVRRCAGSRAALPADVEIVLRQAGYRERSGCWFPPSATTEAA